MHEYKKYGAKHRGHHWEVNVGIVEGASLSIELAMIAFLMDLSANECFGWLFQGGNLGYY